MLRRPILMVLALSACGEAPLDPVEMVALRVINLSGLPEEVAIWMDGQVIAGGLIHTQPSSAIPISAGEHTFGYSLGGQSEAAATAELSVAEKSFNLIALMRGQLGPELRVMHFPRAREGRVTVRAVNASDETARVILRALTAAGSADTLDLEPGGFGEIHISGTTTIRVGNNQVVSPVSISLATGRPADTPRDFNFFSSLPLGSMMSGDVRTIVFHRSPTFVPDIYSF